MRGVTGAACSLTVPRRGLIAVRALQRVVAAAKNAQRLRRRAMSRRGMTAVLICCVLDESYCLGMPPIRRFSTTKTRCELLVSYRTLASAGPTSLGVCGGEPSGKHVARGVAPKRAKPGSCKGFWLDVAFACAWLTLRLQDCNKTQRDIITRQSTPSCKANCTAVAQIAVKRPQVLLDIIKKTSSNQLRCYALPQRWR